MAENPTSTVNIVIDEAKLREQMTAVVDDVMLSASGRLIAAAETLNPLWLQQRDEAVSRQAVEDYKRENGLS